MKNVAIVGGSGYVGGELLRLLLAHPEVEVTQISSRRQAGRFVHFTHPNLRGQTRLRFCTPDEIENCDVLFLALPHGHAMSAMDDWAGRAERVVDLSGDFRLNQPDVYQRWYNSEHHAPEWLERFVYGLPELNRDALQESRYASGVGCNATAVNLALLSLLKTELRNTGLVDWTRGVVAEVKVGSSEGGASSSDASHHPIRSGALRSFSPVGHRHTAEVEQMLRNAGIDTDVHLSATAVERVRGVLATIHVFAAPGVTEKDLFRAFRQRLADEPFVRLVKEKRGLYRYPEPKILSGSNFAEVGFAFDEATRRIVLISAIDNLMKGAAGSAVQSMNLMLGWNETTGLGFPGLHPI